MTDIAKLKEIVALMAANDLAEVSLEHGTERVCVKRASPTPAPTMLHQLHHAPLQPALMTPAPTQGPALSPVSSTPASAPPVAPAGKTIDSPMVGTFYSKPSPDAKSFVTVGQAVSENTVVCIIEAMKVFNEIKAEKSGVIDAILVKDGQAVEFGQKLFSVK